MALDTLDGVARDGAVCVVERRGEPFRGEPTSETSDQRERHEARGFRAEQPSVRPVSTVAVVRVYQPLADFNRRLNIFSSDSEQQTLCPLLARSAKNCLVCSGGSATFPGSSEDLLSERRGTCLA